VNEEENLHFLDLRYFLHFEAEVVILAIRIISLLARNNFFLFSIWKFEIVLMECLDFVKYVFCPP